VIVVAAFEAPAVVAGLGTVEVIEKATGAKLGETGVASAMWQYTHGVSDTSAVSPDGYSLDNFYLARPGADDVQLDLFGDYKSNVALYPKFQEYFRTKKPPFLAVWGKNDPFFLPPGANAFKRDIPDADVRFFDTGHFALETHSDEIGSAIAAFLARNVN
jgi:pimeloyl-ACP methyl ester carboxylesterase